MFWPQEDSVFLLSQGVRTVLHISLVYVHSSIKGEAVHVIQKRKQFQREGDLVLA